MTRSDRRSNGLGFGLAICYLLRCYLGLETRRVGWEVAVSRL